MENNETEKNNFKHNENTKNSYHKQRKNKKLTIQEYLAQNSNQKHDPFREQEKFYRYYENVEPDFSDLIDFNDENLNLDKFNIKLIENEGTQMYKFEFPEGVYFIKNLLSIQEQIEISRSCLNEFIQPPNRTNLFVFEQKNDPQWQSLQNTYNYQELQKNNVAQKSEKLQVKDYNKYNFNTAIRWSNVGSQYDWNTRTYPQGIQPIPQQIENLRNKCIDVTKGLLQGIEKYSAEAVIINYYKIKDTMTGHLDDGETDQKSPIFSFSLGLSCIFLIGSNNKDVKPLAIKINSGDLLVMGGFSRNCWHGVPRVIRDSFNQTKYKQFLDSTGYKQENVLSEENFKNDYIHTLNYLSENRINLNFRQVNPK